ncbi:putative phosphatidylserine decarboxylase [Nemania diffusa]|nr:putative phosphatidylserine decarboxylase [Nemania diffusa]
MEYSRVVQDLVQMIKDNGWLGDFTLAIEQAVKQAPTDMGEITTLDKFFIYMDTLLKWVPCETCDGKEVYRKLCLFYFVFDQLPIYKYQTAIKPENANKDLSCLSNWLVSYAQELGKFHDTPESLTVDSLKSFKEAESYHMDQYIEPHGGWKTFNQFFARYTKPGYRPIADMEDPDTIVSPADATFLCQWKVKPDVTVEIKTIPWPISILLEESEYSSRFADGIFMHSFLAPNDYHRIHAPVAGKVLEAKVIKGQVYLEVVEEEGSIKPVRGIAPPRGTERVMKPALHRGRTFDAPDSAGYQFCQMRGLFVLETHMGLVAVLPIGMAQVSSVIPTAEVGKTLFKGEELGYFQFGGSDVVLVFEGGQGVHITAQENQHYNMGEAIGRGHELRQG